MKIVRILVSIALGLVCSLAEEAGDWRLELLKEKGLSPETAAFEAFRKGAAVSDENLSKASRRLASQEFAAREQAEKRNSADGKRGLALAARNVGIRRSGGYGIFDDFVVDLGKQ